MAKRLLATILIGASLFGGSASAVEEPVFKTVLRDGAFEVRDYPGLIVAEVAVTGDQKEAANRGFRLLAAYIFGANGGRESIAMTAPVAQVPVSEKIAMTAPVTQVQNGAAWTVRFTMPRAYSMETLPVPNDPKVQLRQLPATRFAVLRFSGLARKSEVQRRNTELLEAAQARGLHPSGPVTLAQYNPPWTPWFMRRNEVMAPVDN